MPKHIYYPLVLLFALSLGLFGVKNSTSAQAPWEVCSDGSLIVRCETINCPNGDTNGDGVCSFQDSNGSITDSRNDALCANPISGCGVVNYYNSSTNMCNARVKQDIQNCSLYESGNPNFTPVPSPTIKPTLNPTFTPVPTATPVPSPTSTPSLPRCTNLVAEPTGGAAPTDIQFTAITSGNVAGYQFDFGDDLAGDNDVFVLNTNVIIHRYDNAGEHTARVRVANLDGNYEESASCSTTVTINGDQVLTKGGQSAEKLPETGSEVYGIVALIIMGFTGLYMYERFRVA